MPKVPAKSKKVEVQVAPASSPKIANMVFKAALGSKVDLKAIRKNTKLNLRKKSSNGTVVFEFTEPEAAVLLFRGGSMVITGVTSPEQSDIVYNKVVQEMKDLNALSTDKEN